MSRKCSLAIESPTDSTSSNCPLNAFLLYNNNNNNSLSGGRSSNESPTQYYQESPISSTDSIMGMTAANMQSNTSNMEYVHKSNSLPNLNKEEIGCNVTRFGNRRISICDLNNFSDEVSHLSSNHPGYQNLSTSDLNEPFHRTNTVSGFMFQAANDIKSTPLVHIDDKLRSFQFRNHRRRNSIALKFDTPKVL